MTIEIGKNVVVTSGPFTGSSGVVCNRGYCHENGEVYMINVGNSSPIITVKHCDVAERDYDHSHYYHFQQHVEPKHDVEQRYNLPPGTLSDDPLDEQCEYDQRKLSIENMKPKSLPYERFNNPGIMKGFHLADDEQVLFRAPFRWMLSGQVLRGAYEMFTMERVCSDNDLEIIEKYGDHIGIVRLTGVLS